MPDIDPKAIKGDRICGDCGAKPGALHTPGCDVERCGNCGGQAIACGCTDEQYAANRQRWTGAWPGELEAIHHGLFCHDHVNGVPVPHDGQVFKAMQQGAEIKWHVPCGPDDVGAHPDLNRWHSMGCPPIPPE